jgi:Ala-tRNA(Pro) deacylase
VDTHARIRAWLDAHGIAYDVLEHPPAGSAQDYQRTLGTRLEQQAKALLVRLDTGAHAVVTLQAQKRADLAAVAQLLGAKDAKLANKVELKDVTGCNFGELPPMGKLFGLPLAMDRDLLGEPKIYFNAGRLDRSITLDPRALAAAEGARLY